MNDKRRKSIKKVKDSFSRIAGEIDSLGSLIDDIKDEEEEYRDNIPENLQSSERYEKADEACDGLEDVQDNISSIMGLLDEITDKLMEVI